MPVRRRLLPVVRAVPPGAGEPAGATRGRGGARARGAGAAAGRRRARGDDAGASRGRAPRVQAPGVLSRERSVRSLMPSSSAARVR